MVKYSNTWIGVQIQVKYFDTPHPNSRCFETVLIPEYTVCKLNRQKVLPKENLPPPSPSPLRGRPPPHQCFK